MKHLKTIVSLVLALVVAFVVPLQSMAAGGKYVSEVYVAYGKNAEEAKKTLQDKGFTPVEGNLNENGNTYVMMGYKTTDNIRDSITDIAVMNMDGNFSTTEYKEVLRQRKMQVAELLNELMETVREYRANLRAGKAKATVVHDLLNNITDDDSGMGLGDLFNSETFQDKVGVDASVTAVNTKKLPDLLTILMQGNVAFIKEVESLLAVAADTNENTWLDRFAQTEYDDLLDALETSRPDLNTASKRTRFLYAEYGEVANNLATATADFRQKLLDYEALGLSITTASEDDVKNAFGDPENANDEEKAEIAAKQLQWMSIGSIYENLKNYEGGNYAKGEMLDFFLEEANEDDTERYYPMAAAFTAGQRGGMKFVSLTDLLRYALLDDESWANAIRHDARFTQTGAQSVYSGVNRELFNTDGSVAYTDAADRERHLAQQAVNRENEPSAWKGVFIAWGATAFAGLVFGATHYIKNIMTDNYADYLFGTFGPETFDRLQTGETYLEGGTPLDSDMQCICAFNTFFKFATIFLAIASAIYTVYTAVKVDDVTLKPIPKYFVDNRTNDAGESFQLNYQAVECNREEYNKNAKQSGNSADLNADEGKQWLAIYVSKNSMAGKPVTPDFRITDTATASNGLEGNIHMLGERGAANLCDSALMNYSRLYSAYNSVKESLFDSGKAYVFFKLSKDIKTYDESAGNMTASSIGGGKTAIIGFGGIAIGAVLGALGAMLIGKNKKKKETI